MSNDKSLTAIREWIVSGAWMEFGGRAVAAILIVIVAYALVRLMRAGLDRVRQKSKVGSPLIYIFEQVAGYALLVVGLLAGLATLGIDLSSFTIFAGATGVGVGLGLQGVVKEFVAGLVLIFDPTIQVGDFIELESGLRGEVIEIGARATRLRTNDDVNVVIPNSNLVQSEVVNWTYNEESRRIHVPFSVAEQSDKALVRDVVLAAARALPFTQADTDDRKTQVWLTGFSGDGLDFQLIVWPTPESSRHPSSMNAAYMWAIHEALSAAGVENASPQLDLRVRNLFGHEGDRAFDALKETAERPAAPEPHAKAPNDAAAAVIDDAIRNTRARETATPRKREREHENQS